MHESLGNIRSGFTTCPACLVDGTPQEERMALPGDDHRVSCLTCKRVVSEIPRDLVEPLRNLPDSIKATVMDLIAWKHDSDEPAVGVYRLYYLSTGQPVFSPAYDENDAFRAAAAVAQGHADTLLAEAGRVTIKLSLSTVLRDDSVEITYLPDDLPGMQDFDASDADLASAIASGGVTPSRAKALRELARHGFRIRHIDVHSAIARIALMNGGAVAEVKWLNV